MDQKTESSSEYLGVKMASAITGLKESRIYNLVFNKKIPHRKLGSTILFRKEELIEWLESKKQITQP